jgi:hypothetical protein
MEVSLDEATPTQTKPVGPVLVKDRGGRTLFYAMGVRFRGYVVPDTQCEWALQNAIERFRGMETSLASFVTPVGVFSVSLLWGRYSNFALTVLTITLMVSGIGRVLQRHWCFGDLVAELERAEPLDLKGRRISLALFSLIATAYCSFVVWRIVQAIQSNSF